MCIVTIVLQVLLQLGKISLETKWFARMCEKRQLALAQKTAAKSGAEVDCARAEAALQDNVKCDEEDPQNLSDEKQEEEKNGENQDK